MIAVPNFPTLLKFPLGGARELLDRVLRAGGQMNHLGGGASMEPLAAQVVVANWWEAGGATGCVAAYQAKGAASYAASKVNLANAGTYDLLQSGAVTWATGVGYTFDNGNYFNTGVIPAATSWSYIIQFNNKTSGRFLFGAYQGGSQLVTVEPTRAGNGAEILLANCSVNTFANAATGGNVCLAGQSAYLNGSFLTALTTGTVPTISIWLGDMQGLAGNFANFNAVAFAIYNNTLGASTVAAVAAAMAAL